MQDIEFLTFHDFEPRNIKHERAREYKVEI